MDRNLAKAHLANRVAATSRPTLDDAALELLLDTYPTPDRDGRLADDPAWAGAWDLNAAAAEGWRQKAAMVAGDFSFSADGSSFSKADVMAHCLAMSQQYAARSNGVLRVAPAHVDYAWDGTLIP